MQTANYKRCPKIGVMSLHPRKAVVVCCSFDYQSGPRGGGVSALRVMLARLPARAHSVYYRDEIGNISTSHLRSDFDKVCLILPTKGGL